MFNRPSIKLLLLFVLLLGLALFSVLEKSGATGEVQAQSASSDDRVDSAAAPDINVEIVTDAPKNTGDPVAFVAVIEETPLGLTFAWSFGDGSTTEISNNNVVTHTYAAAGTFEVAVIVSDNNTSDSGSAFTQVTITPVLDTTPTPVAISGLTLSSEGLTEAGSPINFIASWDTGTQVELIWYFGDGSVLADAPAIVSHTYANPGEYIVTVVAENSRTAEQQAKQLKVVITPACITGLDIKPVQTAVLGQPVRFEALVTKGTDVLYTWNFGESSSSSNILTTQSIFAEHTYAQAGSYEVSLVADNACNDPQRTTLSVTVTETPLSGLEIISNSPLDPDEDVLTFVAVLERGIPDEYIWDFGDGRRVSSGTLNTISHVYRSSGNYVVTVTARRGPQEISASTVAVWNEWEDEGIQIFIYDVEKELDIQGVTGSNQEALKLQKEYRFAVIPLSNADEVDVAEMRWNFGDGTIITGVKVTHTYERPGHYGVTATNVGTPDQVYSVAVKVVGVALFMPLSVKLSLPPSGINNPAPTRIPTSSPTATPTATPTEISTMVPPVVTSTLMPTSTPAPIETFTPTPTETFIPVPTETPVPTQTPAGTIPPTPAGTIP